MSVQLFQIGQWLTALECSLLFSHQENLYICFPDGDHLTLNHSVNFQTRLSLHPQLD